MLLPMVEAAEAAETAAVEVAAAVTTQLCMLALELVLLLWS